MEPFDPSLNGPADEPAPIQAMPVDEFDFVQNAGIDPARLVTIHTSGGDTRYVGVEQPTPLSQVLVSAGLTYNGQLDAFVEGVAIGMNDPMVGGQTVSLVGNVKGG